MKHLRLLIYIFGLLYPGSTFSQQTPSSSPQQTPSNFFEHMRKAKEQFDKDSAPQTAADFANSGSDRLQNGDYDGAIADSSKAIELDSKMLEPITIVEPPRSTKVTFLARYLTITRRSNSIQIYRNSR